MMPRHHKVNPAAKSEPKGGPCCYLNSGDNHASDSCHDYAAAVRRHELLGRCDVGLPACAIHEGVGRGHVRRRSCKSPSRGEALPRFLPVRLRRFCGDRRVGTGRFDRTGVSKSRPLSLASLPQSSLCNIRRNARVMSLSFCQM